MPRTTRLPALLLLITLAAACRTELQRGLTPAEADAIVVALEAAGLAPEATSTARDGWSVHIPDAEAPLARRVLQEAALPRPRERDDAGDAPLLPLPADEHRRALGAVERRLEGSLQSLRGVTAARVHLASPRGGRLGGLQGSQEPPRASVLLKVRPNASVAPEAIQRLVAGGLEGLEPAQVTAVILEEPVPPLRPAEALSWEQVGPLRVTPGSGAAARGMLGGLAGLVLLQSAVIAWLVLRLRRYAR